MRRCRGQGHGVGSAGLRRLTPNCLSVEARLGLQRATDHPGFAGHGVRGVMVTSLRGGELPTIYQAVFAEIMPPPGLALAPGLGRPALRWPSVTGRRACGS
jgi:hypothetical protein